jgi:glycosyltransferase involved in cell wall biosynthesis
MSHALTYGGVLSVYEGDNPVCLYESLHTLMHGQSQALDACVGVIEGSISSALERVVEQFPQIRWVRIPRQLDAPFKFGLPAALNKGIEEVGTDVVLKVDTDDVYCRDRVKWTADAFESDPDLVLHGGQVIEWDETFTRPIGDRLVPETHEDIVKYCTWRNPFNGPTVAFKRAEILELGGFPVVGANEDYCLWALILLNGYRSNNSPEIYVHWRGGQNLVKRRSNPRYRIGERQALDYLREIGLYTSWQYWTHVWSKDLIRRLPLRWNIYIYSLLRSKSQEQPAPVELQKARTEHQQIQTA